jgi:geranylgeranyl reductase family protein
MTTSELYDVIVVGGGPAGSTAAWALARNGVKVAVLERAEFPREKVCGDFVEPGGLRILDEMGCAPAQASPPITSARAYFGPRLAYKGAIPYYDAGPGLPTHGLILPRHELDTRLLECAQAGSAEVRQACGVTAVEREAGLMRVEARQGRQDITLRARLVVGADGTESIVAREAGLQRTDRRYIGVSQRAYVEGIEVEGGEASIWFDEDIYPGYGWMFPMTGGRANVGVGILSETCQRHDLTMPKAFATGIEKLRLRHEGCADVRVASRPMGGVVKNYGGVGPNHFAGGVLIGDAGSFVDPMTGEGITQGMESALIAAPVLLDALEQGRFDKPFLSRFEREFRAYFDPAMLYLDLCATIMRNRHFKEFWLRANQRGFEAAASDPDFARVSGSMFGGLNRGPDGRSGRLGTRLDLVAQGRPRLALFLAGGCDRQVGKGAAGTVGARQSPGRGAVCAMNDGRRKQRTGGFPWPRP